MNARLQPIPRTSTLRVAPISVGLSTLIFIGLGTQAGPALARVQPPMGGGGMPGGPAGGGQQEEEKEGPAEEAPKDKEVLRPITAIPAQPARHRQTQLFELHGYLRTRGDFFHRMNFGYLANDGGAGRWFQPPSEAAVADDESTSGLATPNNVGCVQRQRNLGAEVGSEKISRRCGDALASNAFTSANLRLRLQPTLNVTDSVRVHTMIDALDNVVLGSSPDSYLAQNPYAPLDIYSRGQTPTMAGINSFSDSIVVKRAYGEIDFKWGLGLRFGRMPRQWGMGMLYNSGDGYDRGEIGDIVRQLDSDYGDAQDSVELSYEFGKGRRHPHKVTASYNWAASGPTTAQIFGPGWSSGQAFGQEFSIEKSDNVHELFVSIERRDDPQLLKRKVSLGNPVVNYGVAAWLRFQYVDRTIGAPGLGDGLGGEPAFGDKIDPRGITRLGNPISNGLADESGLNGYDRFSRALVHRRAVVITPNIWGRINWRTMRIEFEVAGVFGRFRHRDLGLERADLNDGDITINNHGADLQTPNAAAEDDDLANQDPNITSDEGPTGALLRQWGYALEFKFGVLQDRFHIGLDHGMASGDAARTLNGDYTSPYVGSGEDAADLSLTNNAFRFNPAYTQDLLLFREVLGTASNAVYFRPWAAFYLFENRVSARVDAQYAFAFSKSATPSGISRHYGIELDGAIRYHGVEDPIFVQLQYGILFPLKGFGSNPDDGEPEVKLKAAQTVQAQVGIKF